MARKTNTLKSGYDKFVIKNENSCWDWRGCCSENPGYGQFRVNYKRYHAHVASWILNYGEIPKGMFVCHKCDNRRCSNPDHLYLGTCRDNNLDSIKKGNCPTIGKKRDENHRTKLFTKDFPQIFSLKKQGFSQQKIGNLFGVSQMAVSNVLRLQGVGY